MQSAIVKVTIGNSELAVVRKHAGNAEIGGVSNIRGNDRADALATDQLVGMLANYAFAKWLRHVQLWRAGRWAQDKNPRNGDGGYDLPGLRVDVKGSLIRTGIDPLDHHLIVRPREWHDGWTYVLALVPKSLSEVELVGWATSEMFDDGLSSDPRWAGAKVLPGRSLNPLPPFVWET